MNIPELLRAPAARLSPTNLRFLEFVERHPDCLRRSTFELLDRPAEAVVPYRLQPWPLFLDAERTREVRKMAVALPRLIRSLPQRLFNNDPAKLSSHYGMKPRSAEMLAEILCHPNLVQGEMARGDYVFTHEGLKCLEVNMAGALGGWQTDALDALYRRVPSIASFLAQVEGEATCPDTLGLLFAHILETALPLAVDGALNLIVTVPPSHELPAASARFLPRWEIHLEERWKQTLEGRAPGLEGRLRVCDESTLAVRGGRLYHAGNRVHALIEHYDKPTPEELVAPWLAGTLRLFNGPVDLVHQNKVNLALLSEHGRSDLFSAEERSIIARHVPWTRVIGPGRVVFENHETSYEELLLLHRERLVIKPTRGYSGQSIHIGRATPEPFWRELLATAVRDGNWLVQEHLESVPFLLQEGEPGASPHTVVWGLFAFGDTCGGGFLRTAPRARDGIINSARGADEGIYFEID